MRMSESHSPVRGLLIAVGFLACFFVLISGTSIRAENQEPLRVAITTSMGTIVVELNAEKAPLTVENFLEYGNDNFYEGTIFHRVIPGFMIQGGGFTADMERKTTREPIRIESNNGLKNDRGTIAMARTGDPHSATSQFFINTADNHALNFSAPTVRRYGYTVFGKVVSGMDVVDRIEAVETASRGPMNDVPVTPVVIESISLKP